MTKIKIADKTVFLDSPVSPAGLIGPAMDGFTGASPLHKKDAHVLHSEVKSMLVKRAIEVVPPAQSESGFYSRYFIIPKKDGGLRQILDLRHLNLAPMKLTFRMITIKQILVQI